MEILSKGNMPSANDKVKHLSLLPLLFFFPLIVDASFSLQETQGLGWREVFPAASRHVRFLGRNCFEYLQKYHKPRSRF